MGSCSRTQYKYTTRLHGYRFILAAILAFVLGALISSLFSKNAPGDVTKVLSASSLELAEDVDAHWTLPKEPESAGSNQTILPRGDALPTDPSDILCAWDNPTFPSNKGTTYRPMPVSKGSLNQWGWRQGPSSTNLASNTQEALRGAFAALGFPLTGPDITMSTWVQDKEGHVTIKGEEIEFSETGARYQNAFSARYGFVVAEYNVSPAEQIKRNRAKGMDWEWHAPRLSKWSDVVYVVMRWQAGFGETMFGNYRWCFRAMVKNRETKAIVKQALGGRLQNVRPWPGKSFRVSQDSEVGKALLGSPNGSGVGFMFADRKTDLGKKVVSEIIIFDGVSGEGRKYEDIKPCMAMKIVDKPSGSDNGVASGDGDTNVGAGSNSNPKGRISFWQNLKGLLRGVGRSNH
ncbi:hypothetical protein KC330_g4348 [Hortaea werneckii]|nr:hypothetical protein KC330_g4348 [Hortaea werneckii]